MSWSTLVHALRAALTALPQAARETNTSDAATSEPAASNSELTQALTTWSPALPWDCSLVERLALALTAAAETNANIPRLLATLQHPAAGSRPSVGLLLRLARTLESTDDHQNLNNFSNLELWRSGPLMHYGVLSLSGGERVLIELELRMPPALALALSGQPSAWSSQPPAPAAAVPQRFSQLLSDALADHTPILLRARDPADALATARTIDHQPIAVLQPSDWQNQGWAAWAALTNHQLVLVCTSELPPPPTIGQRPAIAVAALSLRPHDGRWRVLDLPELSSTERAELWRQAAGPAAITLPDWHHHGPSRVAALARIAGHHAARTQAATEETSAAITDSDLADALWQVQDDELARLAQPVRDRIPDQALVLPAAVHEQLEIIEQRCRLRHVLHGDLGIATRSRQRRGVVCCFHGPSGTGKSLAVSWLATRLDLPLYAVDLSALSSKYIGETEKNLSQLLDQAERTQVVLLFDEADALFAQRTDIRDANDRYANQLTNYLLQRLEAFDGIAMLTANSLARIDQAFLRRLDHVCAFPAPDPNQRRDLWRRHLGDNHRLSDEFLNLLATVIELPGGAIRKMVLGAAVRAHACKRAVSASDIIAAIDDEYRTQGKALPRSLTGMTYSATTAPNDHQGQPDG